MANAALRPRPAGLYVSYRRAGTALLVTLTFFLYLWPKYVGIVTPALNPFMLLLFTAVLLGAYDVTHVPMQRLTVFGWTALTAFAAHYALRLLSNLLSETAGSSLYLDVHDLLTLGLLFPVGVMLGRWPNAMVRVARTIAIAMIPIGAMAVFEAISHSLVSTFLLTHIPIGIDEAFRTAILFDKSRVGSFRAQAVFFHPIVLGEMAAASVPVVLGLLVVGRRGLLLPVLALVASVAAAFASGSRAALIGLTVGLLAYALLAVLMSRNLKLWATTLATLPLTTILAWVAYGFAMELVSGRNAEEQLSTSVRADMWDRGWKAFAEAPVFGHGAGNAVMLAGTRGRTGSLTIDDYYLSTLLDYGVVGLLSLAALIFSVIAGTVAAQRPAAERPLHAGFAAGVIVIMICQRALSIAEGMAVALFFAGLLVANQVPHTRRLTYRPAPPVS